MSLTPVFRNICRRFYSKPYQADRFAAYDLLQTAQLPGKVIIDFHIRQLFYRLSFKNAQKRIHKTGITIFVVKKH